MNIKITTTLSDIEKLATEGCLVCYSARTVWWCLLDHHPGYKVGALPADPLGFPLFQTDYASFIFNSSEQGIDAYVAAYHGNIVTKDGVPTTVNSWDKVNKLLC